MENEFQSSKQNSGPERLSPKKKPWKWVILGLAAVIIIFGVVLAVMKPGQKASNTDSGGVPAATMLYRALAKGASQQNIRVAQFRQTFATKADLDSKTDPGYTQSSIAELSEQKFGAVYAQRTYDSDTFKMQRCVENSTYIDGLNVSGDGRTAPRTLEEANEYLKKMYKVTQPLIFIICPHVGVIPGGTIDLAPARLSDGLMPVTFGIKQGETWKDKMIAANLFDVKDEGMVTQNGKQLRKYSLAPANNRTDINKQLYDIFYEAGQIDKIKREYPDAKWEYEFIAINPVNGGSIKGYYLIDEFSGLPVYSELEGVNSDRDKNASRAAKANLGYNRQTYSYPEKPTIKLDTPLEYLK